MSRRRRRRLGSHLGLEVAAAAPALPPHRSRWTGRLPEGCILEVGTGVVHGPVEVEAGIPGPGVVTLAARIRTGFDPDGRLNPGRDPYRIAA